MKPFVLFLAAASLIVAAHTAQSGGTDLLLQPAPKRITSTEPIRLTGSAAETLAVVGDRPEEVLAAEYFRRLMGTAVPGLTQRRLASGSPRPAHLWTLVLSLAEDTNAGDQSYALRCDGGRKTIRVESPGQLGLLYGVVTLSACFRRDERGVTFQPCSVDDRPVYQRRIVAAQFTPDNVEELLDFALRNKIETVAIASRAYPWHRLDSGYAAVLREIHRWKERFGGPRVMQMHNVYAGKQIEIADRADVEALGSVVEASIRHGVDKTMILADDLPPFDFGKGYVLTGARDTGRFAHMAEAHCHLMNELLSRLRERGLTSELYYVPPYYTYEDMYCGDMALFRGTPWEEGAYAPLRRDLAYVGEHMPSDVFIVWSGPYVRSRSITTEDLADWTRNLGGRVPFLWDNTIYSHHGFTTTPLFTAYDNLLPGDFHGRTAGEGMYLNGDLALEETRAAAVTANDFWWDPATYNPQVSLRKAMERLYGAALVPLLMEFAGTELALRRMLGERRLWFEADTLWREIREIRGITDKNPFAYHLNYTRLKALRMQLKASVPKPEPLPEFLVQCRRLDEKRRLLLDAVGRLNPAVSARFRALLVPLPTGEAR